MYKLSEKPDLLDANISRILKECTTKVHRIDPKARVILFGSQARKQADINSDMDIIVILSGTLPEKVKNQLHDEIYEISLEHEIVISSIITNQKEWELPLSKATGLYQSIQKEGVLIE